jgi:hypothetical protein
MNSFNASLPTSATTPTFTKFILLPASSTFIFAPLWAPRWEEDHYMSRFQRYFQTLT